MAADAPGAEFYRQQAKKEKGDRKEACELMAKAEEHLWSEATLEAKDPAEEALAKFRDADDSNGIADALRALVSCHLARDNRKEALQLAKDELAIFQEAGNTVAAAKMMLSIAEVTGTHGGQKKRDEALKMVTDAKKTFQGENLRRFEAACALEVANIHLKAKGDVERAVRQAMKAVKEALALFKACGDRKGEGAATHALATIQVRDEALNEGLKNGRLALAIFKELGIKKLEALEQYSLGQWLLANDQAEDAAEAGEMAAQAFRDLDSIQGESMALDLVVQAYVANKQPADALQAANDGLRKFRSAGDQLAEVAALNMLIPANLANGTPDKALTAAKDAQGIFRSLGDNYNETKMQHLVAQLHFRAGDFDAALKSAESALGNFQSDWDTQDKALMLETVAAIQVAQESHAKALKSANDGRELFQVSGDERGEAGALINCAAVNILKEDYGEAIALASEAQEILRGSGDVQGEATALALIAKVHMANDDNEAGLAAAERARAILRESGDRRECGMILLAAEACIMLLIDGQDGTSRGAKSFFEGRGRGAALQNSKDAVALARRLGDQHLLALGMFLLARSNVSNSKLDDALEAAQEAASLFRRVPDPRGEASALLLQANIYSHNKDMEKATEAAQEALTLFQQGGDYSGMQFAEKTLGVTGAPQRFVAVEEEQQIAPASAPAGATLDIMSLPLPERVRYTLNDLVVQTVGSSMQIEEDSSMMETGMTSITSIMLRDKISAEFPEVENLDLTFVFEYPTIRKMSEFILEELDADDD